jgi:Arc/MetJ-type ribon-helix-helix transcriptional regulator
MVMDTMQIRISHGLVERIDTLVDKGIYSNRSDVIRDAVRRLVLDKMIGIIPNTGDSVKEVKEIREKLSKEKFNLDEINKLAD